jgi:hypothetical protein
LAIRILISKGAHSSSCGFSFTSYKDWQRHDEKFRIGSQWWSELFYHHLSFFNRKSRNEYFALLKICKDCLAGIGYGYVAAFSIKDVPHFFTSPMRPLLA